ncbi:M24 family metallopeptidase [Streptosporangium sp. NBC_01756]|uniref:M24 family metallopeptidase n=1 Tax=Streptosporangium sp. NBC_01756 TaxID=2975950 RepID=UPI002DD7BF55|nr:M24 family metallopeptidase [Streptosporangium sp. NBC_01756]WSC86975.1 M24 family metallopeptidase [Streptosporangium sp. NBC_01756]
MIDEVRLRMAEEGIDALVLRPSPDFRYLGGRGGGYLVVTADRPPAAASGPLEAAALIPPAARRVGVDPEMRAVELFSLRVEAELVLASAVLAPLRLTRGPAEVAASERAASAADAVLLLARELAWFGATERAMARRLRAMMAETGCEEVLSVLVAAGEHSAAARHTPGDRVINPGDALLVAVCGRWGGYCAEVARVFAVAEPPEDFEAMYSVVLAAQRAALDLLRPGVPAAVAGRAALEVIEGSGYGHYAAERPGRGVGLGHDEGPWLDPGDPTVLAPGMTVCVEPAIYLPELFGARVADVVVCTPAGAERLSGSSQALHVIDH